METTQGEPATVVTAADRLRQVSVTAAEVFCIVGTLVGLGVLGTAVEDTADGALAADATLLAPAGPAFSIWSLVYAGLAAYTIWQWLPGPATSARTRATGWLAALSMVLNAAWLLVTQQGWIGTSVVVIVALAATLLELVRRLSTRRPSGLLERVVVDATFGVYLGWVLVAVCANVAAALEDGGRTVGELFAVIVLSLVAGVGILLAELYGGRLAIALASAWGLLWIAAGRLLDVPESAVTGVAALAAAAITVGAAVRARLGREL